MDYGFQPAGGLNLLLLLLLLLRRGDREHGKTESAKSRGHRDTERQWRG